MEKWILNRRPENSCVGTPMSPNFTERSPWKFGTSGHIQAAVSMAVRSAGRLASIEAATTFTAVSRSCQVGPDTIRAGDPPSWVTRARAWVLAASGGDGRMPRNSPASPKKTLRVPGGAGPGSDSNTFTTGCA